MQKKLFSAEIKQFATGVSRGPVSTGGGMTDSQYHEIIDALKDNKSSAGSGRRDDRPKRR